MVFSEDELRQFEAETNILLPQSYKEFCQAFGEGEFGNNFIQISYPDTNSFGSSCPYLESIFLGSVVRLPLLHCGQPSIRSEKLVPLRSP
ncbi:MAG: hypothetical protein HC881_14565 [Leptolyngbyaceae cyanobacterium SL_7_1]|nr:hypothetical protein [Leptolyngbyaceae cyanobacterium SL_7_1]